VLHVSLYPLKVGDVACESAMIFPAICFPLKKVPSAPVWRSVDNPAFFRPSFRLARIPGNPGNDRFIDESSVERHREGVLKDGHECPTGVHRYLEETLQGVV
jgi:hypothetical protein